MSRMVGKVALLRERASEAGQTQLALDLQSIEAAGEQVLSLVTVPAASQSEGAEGADPVVAPQTPETRSSRSSILVVDDSSTNREMLVRRLEQEGYGTATAEDGRAALALARTHAFDVMLLDIMMPGINGYEVLRTMKADPILRDIPVIMISALDDVDGIARCIEMGAEDYLPKPFNKTLLKARVRACLEKKQSHDREMRLFEQLQKHYEELKRLQRLRDDLTQMIVHDLRTPLSSVISGMQTLDAIADLSSDEREIMGIALSGGQSLLTMINGLLDVVKMESGSMPLHYAMLDARELVTSAMASVAPLAEDQRLTIAEGVDADLPRFAGDADVLRRVLVNLLANAIKFTPSGGEISVGARLAPARDSILFWVRDSGEGIPAESFEHIFEKFGQVESRLAGRKMSTGLGLTFCKLAVETHGGSIGVESSPGSGSTFSFTLPTRQVEGRTKPAVSGPEEPPPHQPSPREL